MANSKGTGKTQQRLQDIIEARSETLVGESSAETISIAHIYGCWGSRGMLLSTAALPSCSGKKLGKIPTLTFTGPPLLGIILMYRHLRIIGEAEDQPVQFLVDVHDML